MKRDTDVEKLLADHKAKFDAMTEDFGAAIEAIITARVDARVRPAMAALSGDMSALMPRSRGPGQKVVPKSAGKLGAKATSPSDPARVRFVNAVIKLKPAERAAFAKENGISKFKMYEWLRAAGVKREPHESKPGRRVHTREYKAQIVAKASSMAPGDREIYLDGQGLNRSAFYKWQKELKTPRPAA